MNCFNAKTPGRQDAIKNVFLAPLRLCIFALKTALILFTLSALPARAAHVQFTFLSFNGIIDTNIAATVTPTALNTNGVGLVEVTPVSVSVTSTNTLEDSFNRIIGTNGAFTISNVVPGSYLVSQSTTHFYIVVTNAQNDGATIYATNLLSGLTVAGANAVYTRAQSDSRYTLATNTTLYTPTLTNATLLGQTLAAQVYAATLTGTNASITNLLEALGTFQAFNALITNLTVINATITNLALAGPFITPYATNQEVLTTNAYIHWPNPFSPSSYNNVDVPLASPAGDFYPGIGSNVWEVTVTPGSNALYYLNASNFSYRAWLVSTNNVRVSATDMNASPGAIITVPDEWYRITARKWSN